MSQGKPWPTWQSLLCRIFHRFEDFAKQRLEALELKFNPVLGEQGDSLDANQ